MGDIGRINEQVTRVRTHFGSSNVDAWCVLASHCAKHPPTDLFNATSNMFETKMLREEVTQLSRPKSNIAKTESMKTTGMRTMGTSGKKTSKMKQNTQIYSKSIQHPWFKGVLLEVLPTFPQLQCWVQQSAPKISPPRPPPQNPNVAIEKPPYL